MRLLVLELLAALAGSPVPAEVEGSEVAAIRAELARGLSGLRLEGSPPPYFARVHLVRAQSLTLDGSYGGVTVDLLETQAVGNVAVRVGSAEKGSGGFFGPPTEVAFVLPLEPDAAVARKKVWLAMDGAFRHASTAYGAKQAVLARLAAGAAAPELGSGPVAAIQIDWSPAGALVDPPLPRLDLDRSGLRDLVARLSARFADHPAIDNGDVLFLAMRSHQVTITSEGAVIGQTHDRAVLAVVADTQASDGMRVDHGLAIHFAGPLPLDAELERRGRELVDQTLRELEELAAAGMPSEDYDGPVLLSPRAAAQLLASTVAVHAGGEPAPLSEFGRVTELEPHWKDELGKVVMPPWLELVDDPTTPGFGHYEVDAEGMAGERLALVKEGVLSELLMTRTPNNKIARSNGRARMTPGLSVGPAISNLSLKSRRRGLSSAQLERELLRRAAEDGWEFGYVIEGLRDATVLGPVPRDSAGTYGGDRRVSLPLPARLVRLDADGKRTLVRGAVLSPAPMRILRRIRAVGREPAAVPLRLAPGVVGGFALDLGMDALLSQTVDAEVTTPALLLDGLELLVERGENERLPTLVHPLRRPRSPAAPPAK